MSKEIDDKTVVKPISEEQIADLLDIGGNSVMLPNEEPSKPSVFSQMNPDTTFLDKPDDKPDPVKPDDEPKLDADGKPIPKADDEPIEPKLDTDTILAPPTDDVDDDEPKNKGGRPTTMVAATKSLIEKKILLPFAEDDKKIEDYTAADMEELIEMNFKHSREAYEKELPAQFFENMPSEMQQAYQYIADGGQDLKGLFQAMGASHEMRDINIDNESGQIYAVRSYLEATQYGTPDEIEEEIHSLQDRGDIEKKAKQFKPKLDTMQQNMVNQRLATQAEQNKKRQEQSNAYMNNVYKVLETGKLGDLELDNRTQNMLYAGLVEPNYPSVSGKQTNLLGHLLEKHQWVEPNHELIAEALWLLAEPDAYREHLRKTGATAATDKVVRALKTEQQNLSNASQQQESDNTGKPARKNTLARPKKNFFARA